MATIQWIILLCVADEVASHPRAPNTKGGGRPLTFCPQIETHISQNVCISDSQKKNYNNWSAKSIEEIVNEWPKGIKTGLCDHHHRKRDISLI
jgi:hypothetical protein